MDFTKKSKKKQIRQQNRSVNDYQQVAINNSHMKWKEWNWFKYNKINIMSLLVCGYDLDLMAEILWLIKIVMGHQTRISSQIKLVTEIFRLEKFLAVKS